jgi:aminobenzoyl-glutamate utilization protein B
MEAIEGLKKNILESIDRKSDRLKRLANTVWLYAEPSLQEFRSAELLAKELEAAGFHIQREAGGLETAFVATFGSGAPVLATYAEYDATPGQSQAPVPYPSPVLAGGPGFHDMHNGLGVGAVGAALAIKEVLAKEQIPGTIKVFGTPAEKFFTGKPYMNHAGLFEGLDAVVAWHPGTSTDAETGWGYKFLAVQMEKFIFKATSVTGTRPWEGTSALDGLTLMDVAVQYMKEHILPPTAFFTIHSVIAEGNRCPNATPARAEAWYQWRAVSYADVQHIREGLLRCAQGAAIATGTEFETEFMSANDVVVPNIVLAKAMHKNIELVGPPKFTDADKSFAREIQKTLGWQPTDEPFDLKIKPPSGEVRIGASDDYAEFSWVAPTHRVYVTYTMPKVPHWASTAFACMNIGHQSVLTGAKLVACTLLDLYLDSTLLEQAKTEFAERTEKVGWQCLIPKDRKSPTEPRLPEQHYEALRQAAAPLGLDYIE